jgi:serine/threonine protein kinase
MRIAEHRTLNSKRMNFLAFIQHSSFSIHHFLGMTPERWQKVDEVLQAALDRRPQDRVSFLKEACEGDEELRAETASLICAHDEAGDFIEEAAIARDAAILVDALDNNIGRDIGAYTIIERLGAGGMGEVYLAQDRRLNRRVALKILSSFFASDDMRVRRFQREAQATSALNHPNILTIHEVGEHEDVWFIATEFIEGQTVHELIDGADLSLGEALEIAEQVASALATAHAAGIVHRDIKPENIMRRADGLVKILDFGIIKLLEQGSTGLSGEPSATQSHTEVGVVMGTAGYMSPEQARGLPVDERTDIWSLGVVLYEMLSGRAPFAGATRMDTMVAILEREPLRLFSSEIDSDDEFESLRRVVKKSLNKDRDERYQSVLELAADLKAVCQSLSPSVANVRVAGLHGQELSDRENGVASQSQRFDVTRGAPATTSEVRPKASSVNAFVVVGLAGLFIALIAGVYFYKPPVTPFATSSPSPGVSLPSAKLYTQMSEAEQLTFIREQEQRISAMMGDRPATLSDDAVRAIKHQVDRYVARDGTGPGQEKLSVSFGRAAPYLPLIERSFAARKVPVIIGIYLPMIESAYKPCVESSLGSRGLFQFLPGTAKLYGVSFDEMCDAEKMTPAAAAYIADHMAELGDDAESMTLVLLSYNHGAEWVRSTLRELRDTDGYERNFWTLFAHRDKLDDGFRRESAVYVPNFLAAAIIGENPDAFGLNMPALSTLTTKK